jgi:hypothetical protein
MSVIKASGEENLRADPSVKAGAATDSPSSGGKDMGGTENLRAEPQTKVGSTKDTPSGSADHRPSGVQHFDSLSGDR